MVNVCVRSMSILPNVVLMLMFLQIIFYVNSLLFQYGHLFEPFRIHFHLKIVASTKILITGSMCKLMKIGAGCQSSRLFCFGGKKERVQSHDSFSFLLFGIKVSSEKPEEYIIRISDEENTCQVTMLAPSSSWTLMKHCESTR